MEGTLLVTPEELQNTASDFSAKATEISSVLEEMLNLAAGLGSSWTGSAGDAYRTKFANLSKSKEATLRMLNEHVNDLNEMAEQYLTAESFAETAANDLTEPSFD